MHDIDDSFNAMVSAALCDFMTGFLQDLCRAADHRTGTDLDVFLDEQPSEGPQIDLVPLDDIKTQLYRIEQRERIEYDRIFNLIGPPPMPEDEMAELASQGGSGASTPVGTPPVQTPAAKGADKKKPKKSSKKDLPESVKNKLTNSAAMMAAGGTMKSWMVPGGVTSMASAPPKKLATRVNPKSSGQFAPAAIRANRAVKTNKRIALKDALFVLEGNPMLNNSDTLYKWWANIK